MMIYIIRFNSEREIERERSWSVVIMNR